MRFESCPQCGEQKGGALYLMKVLNDTFTSTGEAVSFLISVRINMQKRKDLTVVEKELLAGITDWLQANAPDDQVG